MLFLTDYIHFEELRNVVQCSKCGFLEVINVDDTTSENVSEITKEICEGGQPIVFYKIDMSDDSNAKIYQELAKYYHRTIIYIMKESYNV